MPYKKPTPSMKAIAATLSFDSKKPRHIAPDAGGFTRPTVRAAIKRMCTENHVIRVVGDGPDEFYLTSIGADEYPGHRELVEASAKTPAKTGAPASPVVTGAPHVAAADVEAYRAQPRPAAEMLAGLCDDDLARLAAAGEPLPVGVVEVGTAPVESLEPGAIIISRSAYWLGTFDVAFVVHEVHEEHAGDRLTGYALDVSAVCDYLGQPREQEGRIHVGSGTVRLGELVGYGFHRYGTREADQIEAGDVIAFTPEPVPGMPEPTEVVWRVTGRHTTGGRIAVVQLIVEAICDANGIPRNDSVIVSVAPDARYPVGVAVPNRRHRELAGDEHGVFDMTPTTIGEIGRIGVGATVYITDVSEKCGPTHGWAARMQNLAWRVEHVVTRPARHGEPASTSLTLRAVCALDGSEPTFWGQLQYGGPDTRQVIACTAVPRPTV